MAGGLYIILLSYSVVSVVYPPLLPYEQHLKIKIKKNISSILFPYQPPAPTDGSMRHCEFMQFSSHKCIINSFFWLVGWFFKLTLYCLSSQVYIFILSSNTPPSHKVIKGISINAESLPTTSLKCEKS